MAKILIEHANLDGMDRCSQTEGMKHLPGGGDFETLCGFHWTDTDYTDAIGIPTCNACIEQAEAVFNSITKKELKSIV